jgi:hypothetical protein
VGWRRLEGANILTILGQRDMGGEMRRYLVAVLLALGLVAGCTSDQPEPPPPTTTATVPPVLEPAPPATTG